MNAIIKNWFWRDSFKDQSNMTQGEFLEFQSYLVLIETDCNHKWTALDL